MRRHGITLEHLLHMRSTTLRRPEPAQSRPAAGEPATPAGRRPKAVGNANAIALRAARLRRELADRADTLTSDELEQILTELKAAVADLNATIGLIVGTPGCGADTAVQQDAPTAAAGMDVDTPLAHTPREHAMPATTNRDRDTPGQVATAISWRTGGLRRHVAGHGVDNIADEDLALLVDLLHAAAVDIHASVELIAAATASARPRVRTRRYDDPTADGSTAAAEGQTGPAAGLLQTT
ncbi:hypothetical protein [Catellatospora paridis]|uniref:hypothetical protein n=1 Tax=Catellatospora paridis TaxID=1617086 RepID=UPI0012D4B3E1|nr:hypothetical protein [Catellatospora paridis]